MNEKALRIAVFIFAAILHILVILFIVFDIDKIIIQERPENPRIIRLIDIDETPPAPPVSLPLTQPLPAVPVTQPQIQPLVELVIPPSDEIAETIIEIEEFPIREIVDAEPVINQTESIEFNEPVELSDPDIFAEVYIPSESVNTVDVVDVYLNLEERFSYPFLEGEINAIWSGFIYPESLRRSGREGIVDAQLFIDRTGTIRSVGIVRETPVGAGFGDYVRDLYENKVITPVTANGEPVSVRFQQRFRFVLN